MCKLAIFFTSELFANAKQITLVELARLTKTEGRMSVIGNLSNNVAIKFNKCTLIRANKSWNKSSFKATKRKTKNDTNHIKNKTTKQKHDKAKQNPKTKPQQKQTRTNKQKLFFPFFYCAPPSFSFLMFNG